jgi:hypothetical protein
VLDGHARTVCEYDTDLTSAQVIEDKIIIEIDKHRVLQGEHTDEHLRNALDSMNFSTAERAHGVVKEAISVMQQALQEHKK